jgi:hypothetical protein
MPSFITHQPGRIFAPRKARACPFRLARIGISVPALAFLDGERALGAGWAAGNLPSPCRDELKDTMTASCAS